MDKGQRDLALEYAHKNRANFLGALKEIIMIPSVSNDPAHAPDIQHAAGWMAAQLRLLGMREVQVFPTARHPIVYGEWPEAKNAPTVLIYGHYDVQPADPLDQWHTGPFEPTVRGDAIFGRGTSDMKAQIVATLKAVEALVHTGGMPVNIKWLLEGEEEIGSPNLESFISAHRDMLASDFSLNTDGGMIAEDCPTITCSLRGLVSFELSVTGPSHDLHSGIYGGAVHNPAIALSELIAGLHDASGRITLPGFYDKVRPLTQAERSEFARLPVGDRDYLEQTGTPALSGEAGYTSNERVGARPSLDVNGILSGFTSPGFKTIIPTSAMAKISIRLVLDQDPQEIYRQFLSHLERHAPKDIHWELKLLSAEDAFALDRSSATIKTVARVLEMVWGTPPIFHRDGGSIPVAAQFQRILGLESILIGFGLPDDNAHAPNEKQHLPTWYKGIDALVHFFMELAPR